MLLKTLLILCIGTTQFALANPLQLWNMELEGSIPFKSERYNAKILALDSGIDVLTTANSSLLALHCPPGEGSEISVTLAWDDRLELYDIDRAGNIVYALRTGRISIIDISDLEDMNEIGEIELEGEGLLFENSGLWVSGELLLVYFKSAGEQAENKLLLFNISNPVNVQLEMEINLTDGLLTYNSDFIFTLSDAIYLSKRRNSCWLQARHIP